MKQIKIPKNKYNDLLYFYMYDLKQLPLDYVKSCLDFLKKRELRRKKLIKQPLATCYKFRSTSSCDYISISYWQRTGEFPDARHKRKIP